LASVLGPGSSAKYESNAFTAPEIAVPFFRELEALLSTSGQEIAATAFQIRNWSVSARKATLLTQL
jgi:hypothetical protein